MGNAASLSISIDYSDRRPTEHGPLAIRAGCPLRGRVMVQVKKSIPGAPLKLFVIGKERVQTSKRSKKHGGYYAQERPLMQTEVVIRDMSGERVRKGNYVFPFSVELASSLPSSMTTGKFHNNERFGAWIQYQAIAQLGARTVERDFLVASSPLSEIQVPCFVEPRSQTIKALGGLRNIGNVTFGASVNDTQIGRGTEIRVAVACRNDTTVDIQNVGIKLVELISYSDSQESYHLKTTLLEKNDIRLPGTGKKTRAEVQQQQRRQSQNLEEQNREIFQRLLDGQNLIRIRIPQNARDSYSGTIISVQHYLKLKLQTQAFVDNVEVKIPLSIGNPPDGDSSVVEASFPVSEPVAVAHPSNPPVATAATAATESSALPQDEIPIIAATPLPPPTFTTSTDSIPPHVIEAPVITISAEHVLLGGVSTSMITTVPDDEPAEGSAAQVGPSDTLPSSFGGLTVLPPPSSSSSSLEFETMPFPLPSPQRQFPPPPPSVASLLEEMLTSVNDLDLISHKIAQPEWAPIFEALSPSKYGTIIAHVNNDFDQPRVAAAVGTKIQQFTCQHCAEALKNTVDWNRPATLSSLLSLCVDLAENQNLIKNELTAWEKTVTEGDFRQALESN